MALRSLGCSESETEQRALSLGTTRPVDFFRRVAVAVVSLSALACNVDSNCERLEEAKREDGGVYHCARAEECPRAANTFVCISTAVQTHECVTCDDATCVRHIPVACK